LEHGRLRSPENAKHYYHVINSQARRLTRLINDILDFSRIEAGMREYDIGPQDLVSIAKEVTDKFKTQVDDRHVTITMDCKVASHRVLADREGAGQAIENLLSNAVKYSPDNGAIRVEVDRLDGFGRVRVVDRGIGIPPRMRKKIFRKFFRVPTAAE